MTIVVVAVSLSAIIILCLAVLVFLLCQRSGRCQKEVEEEANGNYNMYTCLINIVIGFFYSHESFLSSFLEQKLTVYTFSEPVFDI